MKENSDSTIGRPKHHIQIRRPRRDVGAAGLKAAVQSMECFDILY